jgi:hypothetical protein
MLSLVWAKLKTKKNAAKPTTAEGPQGYDCKSQALRQSSTKYLSCSSQRKLLEKPEKLQV